MKLVNCIIIDAYIILRSIQFTADINYLLRAVCQTFPTNSYYVCCYYLMILLDLVCPVVSLPGVNIYNVIHTHIINVSKFTSQPLLEHNQQPDDIYWGHVMALHL